MIQVFVEAMVAQEGYPVIPGKQDNDETEDEKDQDTAAVGPADCDQAHVDPVLKVDACCPLGAQIPESLSVLTLGVLFPFENPDLLAGQSHDCNGESRQR